MTRSAWYTFMAAFWLNVSLMWYVMEYMLIAYIFGVLSGMYIYQAVKAYWKEQE